MRALGRYGAMAACVGLALSWSHPALSYNKTKKTPEPETPVATAESNSEAEARAKAEAEARAKAAAEASIGDTTGTGYGGDSSGQTVSSAYESAYIAVQRNLPSAIGCFGPADGGGGEGGGFAFFGFTPLNKDCWSQEVSAGYEDAQIKARVECGSKWFRDAIGFEIRKRDRQRYCVDWMVERYTAGVEYARQQLEKLEYEQMYAEALNRTRDKVAECRRQSEELVNELEVSRESTRRATEAWQECLSK